MSFQPLASQPTLAIRPGKCKSSELYIGKRLQPLNNSPARSGAFSRLAGGPRRAAARPQGPAGSRLHTLASVFERNNHNPRGGHSSKIAARAPLAFKNPGAQKRRRTWERASEIRGDARPPIGVISRHARALPRFCPPRNCRLRAGIGPALIADRRAPAAAA